jgi:hypothetical protein
MENWIGIGIWIVLGAAVGLSMKIFVKRPGETPGHAVILALFGSFGALVGGMLGVGLFHFYHPAALSAGGFGGAIVLSAFLSWVYRWGIHRLA